MKIYNAMFGRQDQRDEMEKERMAMYSGLGLGSKFRYINFFFDFPL